VVGIAAALGHDQINLVGHDWGAMGAYSCAALHPELVRKLGILEFALPGTGFLEELMVPKEGYSTSGIWGFQSVPDVAQTLIAGREREYLTYFFHDCAYDPTAITLEDIDIYVVAMKEFGALRSGLQYYVNWYRMSDEVRELAKQKLAMPVLAWGGALALQDRVKECMEMLAEDVHGGTVERAGHRLAEERPDFVIETLTEFFV
jgi:pimeloyl-ACP methyl ester carboxylesterase